MLEETVFRRTGVGSVNNDTPLRLIHIKYKVYEQVDF